jgi:cell pole-organizing protein PopZ
MAPVAATTAAPTSAASPVEPVDLPKIPDGLDDRMASLLRPMLRQWLDANMPRIVEKALRVEMAGGISPPSMPVSNRREPH